jgi:hypothetical protein
MEKLPSIIEKTYTSYIWMIGPGATCQLFDVACMIVLAKSVKIAVAVQCITVHVSTTIEKGSA